jgi:gamma-glutamyltranspeptidase/glutathione hydrolase
VEIFLPEGKIPDLGQKILNKDLAKTMKIIAEKGPDVFYQGEIADSILHELQQHGGIITKEDFSVPKLEEKKLSCFTYRGHRILVAPNLGGSALAEILNIASNFDLSRMGYQSPESLHVLIEAMKLAFTDRYVYAADMDSVATAIDGMFSWVYGRDQARRIDLQKSQIFKPGDPWLYQSIGKNLVKSANAENVKVAMGAGAHETTQFDIVDQYGNIVVFITSLRSNFGSGVTVPGKGFVLNNGMALFDPRPGNNNSIAPHKAPLANGAQVIVLKDNKPFLAMGAPGGRGIITATAQVLINMFDYGMNLQDAIDAPRVHSEAVGKLVAVEPRIPETTRKVLENMGHQIKVFPDYHPYFAVMEAIQLNPESGLLFGASDPRKNGAAMGY